MVNFRNFLILIFFFSVNINASILDFKTIPSKITVLGHDVAAIMHELNLESKVICAPTGSIFNKASNIGPYHAPNIELIINCKSDLIISTYSGTPPQIHEKLKSMNYNIINYKANTINDIKIFIKKLSNIFKIDSKPLLSKFENICKKTATKKAVTIIGLNPIYVIGHNTFVADALKCAGFNTPIKGMYPRISLEKLIKINPDYIILTLAEDNQFRDYKLIKKIFKNKIIYIDPDKIMKAAPKILEGINDLSKAITN